MQTTQKQKDIYLMLGGTFLPAFVGILSVAAYQKQLKFSGFNLLLFAGLSAIGGYYTSQILKG